MARILKETAPRDRVVITGMGVIAPNGQDLDTFWNSIRDGVSAAAPVTRFDCSNMPTKIAAELKDFDLSRYTSPKKAKRFDHSVQYALAASILAVRDAGLQIREMDPGRVGVIEATSLSGMESTLDNHTKFIAKGYKGMSAFTLINAYFGGGCGEVSIELGIKGLALTYSSGSASGNDVMGYAYNVIQQDEVDVMVAGGAEAPLLAPFFGGFCLARVLTLQNESPRRAMRPFDLNRDGFVLGEGSAFVVMEKLSHALARGAKIYAEVVSHGRSCEAYHSVAPDPEGNGMYHAMESALRRAGISPKDVDYINAHGTATETNDLVETIAIKNLFGNHARNIAVSSTKPVTGHLLAAAGALETVVCALALQHQEIPLTLNLTVPAPDCDLDYVIGASRPYPVRTALNINVGFGGKNSCLILRTYPSANEIC